MSSEDMTDKGTTCDDFTTEEMEYMVNRTWYVPDWQVKNDLATMHRGEMTREKLKKIVDDLAAYTCDGFIQDALTRRFAVAQYEAGAKTPSDLLREYGLWKYGLEDDPPNDS
jgi:hypothetical protein